MKNMSNVPEYFGCMVFNETVMKERLPKDIYESLRKTMEEGSALDSNVANSVAKAMKDWAIKRRNCLERAILLNGS